MRVEVYGPFLTPFKGFIISNKCLINQFKLTKQQYLKRLLPSPPALISLTPSLVSLPPTRGLMCQSTSQSTCDFCHFLPFYFLFVFTLTSLKHRFLSLLFKIDGERERQNREWWSKDSIVHESNENTGNNCQNQFFKNLKLTKDLQHLGAFIKKTLEYQ